MAHLSSDEKKHKEEWLVHKCDEMNAERAQNKIDHNSGVNIQGKPTHSICLTDPAGFYEVFQCMLDCWDDYSDPQKCCDYVESKQLVIDQKAKTDLEARLATVNAKLGV